jgi:hypothetical protein
MRQMILVVALLLGGCSTSAVDYISKGLEKLDGGPIQDAIEVLGTPDDHKTILGQEVYVWSMRSTYVYTEYASTTTYGTIGGPGGLPVKMAQYSSRPASDTVQCTIKLTTQKGGTVVNWFVHGSDAGCAYYRERIARLIEDGGK